GRGEAFSAVTVYDLIAGGVPLAGDGSRHFTTSLPVRQLLGSGALLAPGIGQGRLADDGFEIFDKVGLVEIAQVTRQPRQVHHLAPGQLFGGVVEPVTFDDPLGADADVAAKDAL